MRTAAFLPRTADSSKLPVAGFGFHLAEAPLWLVAGAFLRRGSSPSAERHAAAMRERLRRDLDHEFTTLRFVPHSEHGAWEGHQGIVPR